MKIRINQDVTFNWKLTVGGESVDLSKLELSVEITTPSNKKTEITPNIQFDTLEFNYRPKQVGEYILSAYLNRFKDGETALDIKAFEGVKYTWNQDFSIDDNLEANYVELAGDFNFGPNVSDVPSVPSVDLSDYAKTSYVDTQINNEATARTQADSELQSKINTKQDTLTAGENIKIENNVISAIDLRPSVDLSDYAKTTYVDTQIASETTARTQADSELQSKINTKQDKIIAGAGINITDNTISCTLDTTIFKVVNSLPATPPSSDKNKIHLVLSTNSEEGNTYDEYLWANNSWEKIGSYIPSVDLSDYAKTAYVDTQIASETTARTQADSELQSKINTKQDTLTAGENINIENNVISAISVAKISLNTTWSELKGMRDNSQLVAGQQYRITDYTCTTTDVATKSAGHVFDIIVTAYDESTLNEVARAVKHDGDEYFANSDLSAWKIWYCLDNDTNRFAWADSTNGKGVIYRMIDDLNNDVPYDFKNIQFYRQWDDDKQLWCTISTDNTGVPCYTFSSSGVISTVEFTDTSLSKSNYVYSNSIKWFIKNKKQTLNNICFFGTTYYENKFLSNCRKNTFGNNCSNNSFGESCYSNVFGPGCHSNTFGHDLHSNTFVSGCGRNTLGNKCENNSFGWGCSGNIFGSHCSNNIFVRNLLDNTFGNDCDYNSFGEMCLSNSFGNNCSYNSFGDDCEYNSFGNKCSYIKFASDSSATTKYGYYQNNHFGDGCAYIVFTGAESVSSATNIQNYNFAQGLQGTADNYLIVEGKRNRAYETYISKGTNGTIKESVIAESINTIDLSKITDISYAEVVALRSNSNLDPGQQYRITDYTCTTTQAATKSAGHVFDIIVTADSESVLNEEARAIKHDGDTYFTNCDLNAWKIWYSLDNDTNRFDWADSANGKGVIYRMIDEFNNDCPYDFKNIQFYRQYDSSKSLWSTISSDNTGVPCYTFSSDGSSSTTSFTDMSLSASNNVYSNVIRQFIKNNKQTLNNICFFGTICNKNTFGADCRENTFGNKCSSNAFGGYCFLNSFGNECNYNSFGAEFNQNSFGVGCSYNLFGSGCYINSFDSHCYLNSFGSGCHNNSFGRDCYLNSFGSGCHNNSFGSDCDRNSFGSDCNNNSFVNNCDYNSFENNCYSNSFRSNCNSNSFGNNCYSNSFVNECNSNSFGNNCYSNSFGSNCYSNSFGGGCNRDSFGNSCSYNSFGSNCNYIIFASSKNATTKYAYYQNNHFGDSCSFIIFKGAETASASAQVQNYNLSQGLRGQSGNAFITIDGKRGRAYETKVAKNSSGTLKIYCEADLSK